MGRKNHRMLPINTLGFIEYQKILLYRIYPSEVLKSWPEIILVVSPLTTNIASFDV